MNLSTERLPPLAREHMDDAQRASADALTAGPRNGVKGPFIPLLRSPSLLAALMAAGDYLRFASELPRRAAELATLAVARQWSQQFEWHVHVPLARDAGTSEDTLMALRTGSRPTTMDADEALVYDFMQELSRNRGISDATYSACRARFGERGVVDLVGLIGYFTLMCMLLNVAGTRAGASPEVAPLPSLPL